MLIEGNLDVNVNFLEVFVWRFLMLFEDGCMFSVMLSLYENIVLLIKNCTYVERFTAGAEMPGSD